MGKFLNLSSSTEFVSLRKMPEWMHQIEKFKRTNERQQERGQPIDLPTNSTRHPPPTPCKLYIPSTTDKACIVSFNQKPETIHISEVQNHTRAVTLVLTDVKSITIYKSYNQISAVAIEPENLSPTIRQGLQEFGLSIDPQGAAKHTKGVCIYFETKDLHSNIEYFEKCLLRAKATSLTVKGLDEFVQIYGTDIKVRGLDSSYLNGKRNHDSFRPRNGTRRGPDSYYQPIRRPSYSTVESMPAPRSPQRPHYTPLPQNISFTRQKGPPPPPSFDDVAAHRPQAFFAQAIKPARPLNVSRSGKVSTDETPFLSRVTERPAISHSNGNNHSPIPQSTSPLHSPIPGPPTSHDSRPPRPQRRPASSSSYYSRQEFRPQSIRPRTAPSSIPKSSSSHLPSPKTCSKTTANDMTITVSSDDPAAAPSTAPQEVPKVTTGKLPQDQHLFTYPFPPEKGAVTIRGGDLNRLTEPDYLNDNLVEFFVKHLRNDLNPDAACKMESLHIYSPFFYNVISPQQGVKFDMDSAYRKVMSWTRHTDIFSKDYLVIPINEANHWYMAVVAHPGAMLNDPPQDASEELDATMTDAPAAEAQAPENPSTLEARAELPPTVETESKPEIPTSEAPPVHTCALPPVVATTTAPTKADTPPNPSKVTEEPIAEDGEIMGDVEPTEPLDDGTKEIVEGLLNRRKRTRSQYKDDKEEVQPRIQQTQQNRPKGKRESDILRRSDMWGRRLRKQGKAHQRDLEAPAVLVLDSLSNRSKKRKCVERINKYLEYEALHKRSCPPKQPALGVWAKVPCQDNYIDCGLYMLHYIEMFARMGEIFHEKSMMPNPSADELEIWDMYALREKRGELERLVRNTWEEYQKQVLQLPSEPPTKQPKTEHDSDDDVVMIVEDPSEAPRIRKSTPQPKAKAPPPPPSQKADQAFSLGAFLQSGLVPGHELSQPRPSTPPPPPRPKSPSPPSTPKLPVKKVTKSPSKPRTTPVVKPKFAPEGVSFKKSKKSKVLLANAGGSDSDASSSKSEVSRKSRSLKNKSLVNAAEERRSMSPRKQMSRREQSLTSEEDEAILEEQRKSHTSPRTQETKPSPILSSPSTPVTAGFEINLDSESLHFEPISYGRGHVIGSAVNGVISSSQSTMGSSTPSFLGSGTISELSDDTDSDEDSCILFTKKTAKEGPGLRQNSLKGTPTTFKALDVIGPHVTSSEDPDTTPRLRYSDPSTLQPNRKPKRRTRGNRIESSDEETTTTK